MTHGEAAHERGTHNMFTGYKPSPAIKFPSFGSVVCLMNLAVVKTCLLMFAFRMFQMNMQVVVI